MLNEVYQVEVSTQQNNSLISINKASLSLKESGFVFTDEHSKTSKLDFVEVNAYCVGNHQLELNLDDKNIYLRGFGRHFTEFVKDFKLIYNEFLRRVLFLNGHGEVNLFTCKASVTTAFLTPIQFDDAELILFEDRISLIGNNCYTLHFSEIIQTAFSRERYEVEIYTPASSIKIYYLGRQTDFFLELFEKRLSSFANLSLDLASQLFDLPVKSLEFVREGRLISQDRINEIGIKNWDNLLSKILVDDVRQTAFTLLKEFKKDTKIYYSFKRKDTLASQSSAKPDIAGFIHWFVFVYGKAAAVEVVSDDGYATYFYNLSDAINKDIQSTFWQEQKIDINTYLLNRSYILLNFNREPISLAQESFPTEKSKAYAYAINRLNYLTDLRKQFIGKVGHYDKDQWEKQANKVFEAVGN